MCFLFILFGVLLLIFFLLLFFNVLDISFVSLGLNDVTAFILMLSILLGSLINIPVKHRNLPFHESNSTHNAPPFVYYYPPKVTRQVIAVNLGGAIIPIAFCIYLFFQDMPIWQTLVGIAVAALISWSITKPVRGVGFQIFWLIPPLIAGLVGLLLAGDSGAAPVAFISGVVGTIIGVYVLNFYRYNKVGPAVINIGGGGIFSGIFLTGVVAVLLSGLGS